MTIRPNEPRRMRFWRWVHALAERRIREIYMDRHKHDRRCPNCGRWGALGGFDWAGKRDIGDWHEGLTCLACGHESRWFMGGMLPELDEPAAAAPAKEQA